MGLSEEKARMLRINLEGVCDLHLYAEPDVQVRAMNDKQIAAFCRDVRFRA